MSNSTKSVSCRYHFKRLALYFHFAILITIGTKGISQCNESSSIIYRSHNPNITFSTIAEKAAPLIWFSPDEPKLYNQEGSIAIPEPFPYDQSSKNPIVYYKIREVFSSVSSPKKEKKENALPTSQSLRLDELVAIKIEYYMYYSEETGLGGHPHDLESVSFQIRVNRNTSCPEGQYSLEVLRVIARAHGLYWFENALNTDQQTVFPISILVEEGKHANCTDKNADGIYTPGFDVTEKVNDAWGVRDIISTGRLYSGGFQGWMAKVRTPSSILVPPNFEGSDSHKRIIDKFPTATFPNIYRIRPFAQLPEKYPDKKLAKMVKSKKPRNWPEIKNSISPNENFFKLSKDNKLRNKIGFTWRWDEGQGISFTVPLLFVKHVEAPMTGGWFYQKFYFGDESDAVTGDLRRILGHQIQHTTSASRWLDTYLGLGYEILDDNPLVNVVDPKVYMASEIGLKVRVNITKTPLKFLKILGTDYWGVKIGWKNLGFNPFIQSGFVVEVGAGAF